jgi:lipoprotein-anchoring transpeptidase ErfK/SrfK
MFMHIEISISEQTLTLFDDSGKQVNRYAVSTAANGVGCLKDSGCTPLGQHIIRAKIGADAPENTVFRGRRPTGEIFAPELKEQFPERDWILTRILWLSGTEPGKNRLGNVDTMQRYIYIHGSPDATEFGAPGSHGCVRMRNADLIALFEQVPVGTTVNIYDQTLRDQNQPNQLPNDHPFKAQGLEGQPIQYGVND